MSLSTFTLLSYHHHHTSTELFLFYKTETLYLLSNNSSLPPSCNPSTKEPPFYFLSVWIWVLKVPHVSESILYLSSWDWLTSLSVRSSEFIHVVAWREVSFRMTNDPWQTSETPGIPCAAPLSCWPCWPEDPCQTIFWWEWGTSRYWKYTCQAVEVPLAWVWVSLKEILCCPLFL